jgi:cyclopropane fatty-acyl-phospholipid synthase-like methyltransferase
MKVTKLLTRVLTKLINPKTYIALCRIRRERKRKKGDVFVDSSLKLYAQITPGQFLHYPYFSDPDVNIDDISRNQIKEAGENYVRLIIDKIEDRESPVLDVGCGLGELSNLLHTMGYSPVALTPDQYQCECIRKNYPDLELIESKFEDIDSSRYGQHFGTIITAESLQYLKLDRALPLMGSLLKPGGLWIIGDYFKLKEKSSLHGGKQWVQFVDQINKSGWEIASQQDITRNILPFIAYCNVLGSSLLIPIIDHCVDWVRRKKPGIFYLVGETLELLRSELMKLMDYIDPDVFCRERKYMMLVLKKTA